MVRSIYLSLKKVAFVCGQTFDVSNYIDGVAGLQRLGFDEHKGGGCCDVCVYALMYVRNGSRYVTIVGLLWSRYKDTNVIFQIQSSVD